MKKIFKLPEKWCVKPNIDKQECQIVRNYFNNTFTKNYGANNNIEYYWHFPPYDLETKDLCYYKIVEGYTQISFEEFNKYVINRDNTINIDYTLLKNKLKQLNKKWKKLKIS